jgi:selenocysteine insertion sequence-binding protein 2
MHRSFADAIKGVDCDPKKAERRPEHFAWNVSAQPRVFPIPNAANNPGDCATAAPTHPLSLNFPALHSKKIQDQEMGLKHSKRQKPQLDTKRNEEHPPRSHKLAPSKKFLTKKKPKLTANNESTKDFSTPTPADFQSSEKGRKNYLQNTSPSKTSIKYMNRTDTSMLERNTFEAAATNRDGTNARSIVQRNSKTNSELPSNSDSAHDLLKLMRDGKMVVKNKGRQRIRPQKKKFSALKKKVLEERLRRWRDLHPEDSLHSVERKASSLVCIIGLTSEDELEDDDEYNEIRLDLLEMAEKIGQVENCFVFRPPDCRHMGDTFPSFVKFKLPQHANAAVDCWHGITMGGKTLNVFEIDEALDEKPDFDWQGSCLASLKAISNQPDCAPSLSRTEMHIENVITVEDLQDEEGLQESLSDVRELAARYGDLKDIRLKKDPTLGLVLVYEVSFVEAQKIAEKLSKHILGGQPLHATVVSKIPIQSPQASSTVIVTNVLTEDDLSDTDCLQESLDDLRELVGKHGVVNAMSANISADPPFISIQLSCFEEASATAHALNGVLLSGSIVSATTACKMQAIPKPIGTTAMPEAVRMFSGDKLIPDRFIECKRVPKVSGITAPRPYATLISDESVKPLLTEMFGELMRLQKRAVDENNTKVKRRLVMGLREVARGIRSHKVKLVAMANNLDDYGAIDEKLQEILDLADENEVPIFYEFSKRALGKVMGKTVKIAVVGVQNAEGAHQQFKKLLAISTKAITR